MLEAERVKEKRVLGVAGFDAALQRVDVSGKHAVS